MTAIPAAARRPGTAVGKAPDPLDDELAAPAVAASEETLEALEEAADSIDEMLEAAAPVMDEILEEAVAEAPLPMIVLVTPSLVTVEMALAVGAAPPL